MKKEDNKEEREEEEKKVVKIETEPEKKEGGKPGLRCLACKAAAFENNTEFRTHFKTEWHNFNLKRKIEVSKLKITLKKFIFYFLFRN